MIRRSVSCRPILLGLLTASVVGSLAARAGGQVVIPTCRLAQELRAAFGFWPQALAGLGVNSAAFSQIATVAASHCEQNRPALEPLLEAVRAARADLFRAFETFDHEAAPPGDAAILAAEQALSSALAALANGCGDIVATLTGLLSAEQQTLHARLGANQGLDAPWALLDLTAPQRTTIRAAQRDRDKVLRHHRLRKHLPQVLATSQSHASQVAAALTPEQQTELAQLVATQQQHQVALLEIEEGLCGGE